MEFSCWCVARRYRWTLRCMLEGGLTKVRTQLIEFFEFLRPDRASVNEMLKANPGIMDEIELLAHGQFCGNQFLLFQFLQIRHEILSALQSEFESHLLLSGVADSVLAGPKGEVHQRSKFGSRKVPHQLPVQNWQGHESLPCCVKHNFIGIWKMNFSVAEILRLLADRN